MTTLDSIALFDLMDAVVDLISRANCSYAGEDDAIYFRKLQKERLPGLSDEQARTLFIEWSERYAAKVERDRIKAFEGISAQIREVEERARVNPPAAAPYVCPHCGAYTEVMGPDDLMAWLQTHHCTVQHV